MDRRIRMTYDLFPPYNVVYLNLPTLAECVEICLEVLPDLVRKESK